MNGEKMKIEISDEYLGTRTIEGGDDALIQDQLKLLRVFQRNGNQTQKLKDDIEFYEFILSDENPARKAGEYLKAKDQFRQQGMRFEANHPVGDLLGWVWRKQ